MWGKGPLRRIAAAAVTICTLAAPSAALAADSDSVAMVSDQSDYIGAGQPFLAMPPTGGIAASMGANDSLDVDATAGSTEYQMNFTTADGATMAPGVYAGAQRTPFRAAGHPGMNITSGSRGCNELTGSYEVKDIAFSGATVTRLWLVFEQHCEGNDAALFGEIRIGETGPAGVAALAPSLVRWPNLNTGAPTSQVPVTIRAAAPMSITSAAIQGPNASEFTIRGNDCAGKSLLAGDSCKVSVRYERLAAGVHSATLKLTDSDGTDYSVPLAGSSYRTRYVYVSDANDWVGSGTSGTYTNTNATISAHGSPSLVSFVLNGVDGYEWDGAFSAGSGNVLTPGDTYTATRYPFNGASPGIDVGGRGHGCSAISGTFTIRELAFDSDGNLGSLGLTFVQNCENAVPALCGIFEFHATGPSPGSVPPGGCGGSTTTGGGSTVTGGGSGTGGTITTTTTTTTTPSTPISTPPTTTTLTPVIPAAPKTVKRTIPAASPCAVARFSRLRAVIGTSGANTLSGGSRRDRIFGLAGRDVLRGGDGDDCIDGGGGNDTLYGGLGHDVLNCGSGHDVAYTTPGDVVHGCERTIREHPKKWVKLSRR